VNVARAIATSLAILLVEVPAARADDASMLAKAERSNREATTALGRDRIRRNDERAALTAKMQAAYARLTEARRATEQLVLQRDRVRESLDEAVKEAKSADRATRTLAETVRQTSQLPRNADPEEMATFEEAAKAGLDGRLAALRRATELRVETTEVIDRAGKSVDAKLIHIGAVRSLVAGTGPDAVGLARTAAHGKWLVDGPHFLADQVALTQAAIAGGTALPFDVDGTLIDHATAKADAKSWLSTGGPFVWPIVIVGLLGLVLLLERIWYLGRGRVRGRVIQSVCRALGKGELDAARALVSPTRSDLDRVLLTGVDTAKQPEPAREAAMEAALLAEEPRLERSLTLLAAAAGVAPLLGLLGTVTGMIETFEIITQHGTGNPRLLSGGISVALITTQLGLLVAVPLLLGHAWASRAVERRQALLEEGRTVLLGVNPPTDEAS